MASDIPNSCAKFITKLDELTVASDSKDMVKVLNVAKALANTSLLVVCNKTEKELLTEKQNAIRSASNQVDSLMVRARKFLDINLSDNEILSQNEHITEAAQVVKDKIEGTIADVQNNQTKLEYFSGALDSLRSWFFCFVGGQDYCNSKNTTTTICTTTTSTTKNIETTTTPSTKPKLTELATLTDSAAKIKRNSEVTIIKAQSRKVTLKSVKATLFQLQGVLFLGSGNISESTSRVGFTPSTQLAPLGAMRLENNSDCNDSCQKLINCFNTIAISISNENEKEALAIAQDLKLDISNLNCTPEDKLLISKHISDATDTASEREESLSSVVREEVSKLISTLGSILAANEDLIKLGKSLTEDYLFNSVFFSA